MADKALPIKADLGTNCLQRLSEEYKICHLQVKNQKKENLFTLCLTLSGWVKTTFSCGVSVTNNTCEE